MPEVPHPNPEPWDEWKNFPGGPVKRAIEAIWADNLELEEKVGAHFALQVSPTDPTNPTSPTSPASPISGYRVYVV